MKINELITEYLEGLTTREIQKKLMNSGCSRFQSIVIKTPDSEAIGIDNKLFITCCKRVLVQRIVKEVDAIEATETIIKII